MQSVLWTFASLIAYIAGLVIIARLTPLLLLRNFDELAFMGIAAAEVVGGILSFGAVVVTFSEFNGVFAIRVLDLLLLVGILIIGVRMSLRSFRPRIVAGTFRVSRILAGTYCLLLSAAALYYILLLFTPSG